MEEVSWYVNNNPPTHPLAASPLPLYFCLARSPPSLSVPWEFQMDQVLSKTAPLMNKEDLQQNFYWLWISNLFLFLFKADPASVLQRNIRASGRGGDFSNFKNT